MSHQTLLSDDNSVGAGGPVAGSTSDDGGPDRGPVASGRQCWAQADVGLVDPGQPAETIDDNVAP